MELCTASVARGALTRLRPTASPLREWFPRLPQARKKDTQVSFHFFFCLVKAQRRMTSPKVLEVQEICYLMSETLYLGSLKQLTSPEKTPLSSEERSDLHKVVVLVLDCPVLQKPKFQKGQKWCIFPLLFSYSFPVVLLITLGSWKKNKKPSVTSQK